MLAGLGFDPFFAAGICLLANTAPVAFGSIGIPVITLAGITGLPLADLSANVGRICAPVSVFVPAYLVVVMTGFRGLKGVLPAAAVCGIAFASAQFFVSNYIGPQLTDILGALASMGALIVLLRFWSPKDDLASVRGKRHSHSGARVIRAWVPYGLLVILVLLIGYDPIKNYLNQWSASIPWPGLHNQIMRVAPAVKAAGPYPALFNFNFFTASGTATMVACFLAALALGMSPAQFGRSVAAAAKQLALPLVTVASVLALAFLLNYCGATATLGLAFAATGVMFPFFSSLLGWLGVFLTGSDTSANALFGNLQVVTAGRLDINPVLMAASNSSGGVMGKMISLQSIAVAAAASGMPTSDESRLFRFTLKHSIFLASVLGLITAFYAVRGANLGSLSGAKIAHLISLQSIAVAAAASGMPTSDESRLLRFHAKTQHLPGIRARMIAAFYTYGASTGFAERREDCALDQPAKHRSGSRGLGHADQR